MDTDALVAVLAGDVWNEEIAGNVAHRLVEIDRAALEAALWPGPEDSGARAFPAPLTATKLMDRPEPEIEWLAEGFLPASGNVLVAGYPKTFKTTLLQDLAVSLASGSPFLDKFPVDSAHHVGLVLMEGLQWQAARRIRRLCLSHGLDPREVGKRIHIWHRPPLVLNPTTVAGLAAWVSAPWPIGLSRS